MSAGHLADPPPAGRTGARGRRTPRPSGDEREQAILATAERLLGERPFADVSVDDLARGAGLSRPAFYFYFASKEAVLLALLDRAVARARATRDAAVAAGGDDPAARWRQVISAIHDTFATHRATMLAAADAAPGSPAVRALWARVMERFVTETATEIDAERARGAAPPGIDSRDLAIALNAMNERVLHAGFAGQSPALAPGTAVDVLLEVWLRAVYGQVPAGLASALPTATTQESP